MTVEKDRSEFERNVASQHNDAPAAGDTLVHNTDVDGQVSNVDITADAYLTVQLYAQDGDGSNQRVLRTFTSSDVDRGSFEDEIAKVGANRDVVLEVLSAGNASSASLNVTVDEYKH